jgi:hypothetical protein
MNASLDRLNRWVANGTAPNSSDVIDVVHGAVVRDAYGNALGGIRLPELEVPTATLTGPGNSGAGSCPVGGVTTALDAATLASLYSSHGKYVAPFVHATNDLRSAGFILDSDADELKNEAGASNVGH